MTETFGVAVIGGGPAGIAAAVVASSCGKNVVLLDQNERLGGQIWRGGTESRAPGAREWIRRVDAMRVTQMLGATVCDVTSLRGQHQLIVEQGGKARVVNAAALVIATGARERFLPFPGWTLPGVLGVGAAQALLKSGLNVRGKRVVLAGSGALLLPVAASYARSGAKVELVAEQAGSSAVFGFAASLVRRPALLAQAALYRAQFLTSRYSTATWVTRAIGDDTVRGAEVVHDGVTRTIPCDMLCVAYNLLPATELARLIGCSVSNGSVLVEGRQLTTVERVYSAGETTGIGGVDLAIVEGKIAGLATADQVIPARLESQRARLRDYARRMDAAFALRPELRSLAEPDTIVCRCEDVRMREIAEGSTSRSAKLHTRAGMGACQGRVCGSALEFLRGWSPDRVRLPVEPVLLSTLLAEDTADHSLPKS